MWPADPHRLRHRARLTDLDFVPNHMFDKAGAGYSPHYELFRRPFALRVMPPPEPTAGAAVRRDGRRDIGAERAGPAPLFVLRAQSAAARCSR